jgi:hypothetical protein
MPANQELLALSVKRAQPLGVIFKVGGGAKYTREHSYATPKKKKSTVIWENPINPKKIKKRTEIWFVFVASLILRF